MAEVETWHHGLVARWWAEFNRDGPEVAWFRGFVEQHGEPALDVGCGTGRLLLPLARAGLDIDGIDVSGDMLAYCRNRAQDEGLEPGLTQQPMHRLNLERRYRTIFACGSFGLGGTWTLAREALRRFRRHLRPGGAVAIDLPGAVAAGTWRAWAERQVGKVPRPWPREGERKTAGDGSVLELRSRLADIDPEAQTQTVEIRVELSRDGALVEADQYSLLELIYAEDQLAGLLEEVGFGDVSAVDGYELPNPKGGTQAVRILTGRRCTS